MRVSSAIGGSSSSPFDAVVFSGGGCRCFWQAGFWATAAPALGIAPRVVSAVSAGSAVACAALAGRIEAVLEDFERRAAENERNLYPRNWRCEDPVFPHERMYRATILSTIDSAAFEALRRGPELRILVARPPRWLGGRSGFAVGALAYQLDRLAQRVHPIWGRRVGFLPEVIPVSDCETPDELASLILQSSCTPPLTPLYRRDGRAVLDGGLFDTVPVDSVGEARSTLVLLSRQYRQDAIPQVRGRTYVQPSAPIPIQKWDYTSPDRVRDSYELGLRDGERFARRRS